MISFIISLFSKVAMVTACCCMVMSFFLLFRFQWNRGGPILWVVKSCSSALALILCRIAIFSFLSGMITGSYAAILPGAASTFIFFVYLYRIAVPPDPTTGFEKAFGPGWEDRIPNERKTNFLTKPAVLRLPDATGFVFQQNLPFYTIPGTNRSLLCDLWLPSGNVKPSGLAFIYLHSSAWYFLDKDFGTRPLFRHLASQGHVIMDVAYRLFPETDMTGMVHDAKRAIAWMKANASLYNVNRDQIVIGGGSAGGHLALLSAYSSGELKLIPPEVHDADLTVNAVVAAYGPPDLEALYYHTGQHLTTKGKTRPSTNASHGVLSRWMKERMRKDYHRLGMDRLSADAGALAAILGCHPDECPEVYAFFSPVTHVHRNCPPTLLLHGGHDMFTPVKATRRLYKKLKDAGVPTVMHLLPQTDHGYDLFLPERSPVAHTAFYDIERFLGIIVARPVPSEKMIIEQEKEKV